MRLASLKTNPSDWAAARVQPTAERIHQLTGTFAVNYDLCELSPGIIIGKINGVIPIFLSEDCWADLLPEMSSLWHPIHVPENPLNPIP
jgi:hypothetical protein